MMPASIFGRVPRSREARSATRLVPVALVLLAAAVAPSSHAQKIYWSDADVDYGIHRADPDGSDVELVVPGAENLIAIDEVGRKVYWLGVGTDGWELARANLDGSQRQVLHQVLVPIPEALVVDGAGGWVYISATAPGTPPGDQCFEIRRYRSNGTGSHETLVPDVCAFGLAVDPGAGKLYWAQTVPYRAIRRANLDGSDDETVVEFTEGSPGDMALDAERGKLYFVKSGTIFRVDTDGSNLESVHSGGQADFIALDLWSDKIYWTSFADPRIMRVDLDGSNPELALETDGVIRLTIDFDSVADGADVPALSRRGQLLLLLALAAVSAVVLRRRGTARSRSSR